MMQLSASSALPEHINLAFAKRNLLNKYLRVRVKPYFANGMRVHIGTSGWSYAHWHPVLYPPEARPWQRLGYYTHEFQTVEINSSFYRWPTTAAFKSWRHRLPDGFLLSVKAPRALTHTKRLYQPEKWLERIGHCWHELAEKRAVLLVQLSPNFAFDLQRLSYFLQQTPRWIKLALEFRHPSWHREEVFNLLQAFDAAYCIMSGAHLPCLLRATAPFVYVRLHGPSRDHLYGGTYSDADLRWWTDRIREWVWQGKEVYVYFNNDGEGNAVHNARRLKQFLG